MSNYKRGRGFEYKTRNKLYKMGAVLVQRSGSSKGPADLIALFPPVEGLPVVWLVQCKLAGYMPPAERDELRRIGIDTCTHAYLAKPGKNNRGVEFVSL